MAAPFHILIVEDEPVAAEQIAEFLGQGDMRVTIANNAIDGLAVHQNDPAGLILTDLRMPGGDGFMLIRAVRAHSHDLPVVVITGQLLREEEADYVRAEASAVLRKPIDLRELLETVERLRAS